MDDPSFKLGEEFGKALLPLILFIWGAWKCDQISKRPRANTKAVRGLLYVLAGLAWLQICRPFSAVGLLKGVPAALVLVLAGVLVLFGMLMSFIGLIEIVTAPKPPPAVPGRMPRPQGSPQGVGQAITALVLGVVVLGGMVVGFIIGFRGSSGVPDSLVDPVPTTQTLTFDAMNVKFNAPGKPWVKAEAKKLNPVALLAFVRARPQVFFMVIAESPGVRADVDTGGLAEVVKANLAAAATTSEILEESPQKLKGLDGDRIVAHAKLGETDISYVYWVCSYHGFFYQLVTWGQDAAAVKQQAASIQANFDLIDPKRVARGTGTQAADYVSERYGYKVRWSETSWSAWPDFQKKSPSADFGLLLGNYAAFVVVPVSLMGDDPSFDHLVPALASRLGIEYPGQGVSDFRIVTTGGVTGCELDAERVVDGTAYSYRLRILKSHGIAYLLASWVDKAAIDRAQQVLDIHSKVDFLPAKFELPALSERERHAHSLILNDIGLHCYNARAYTQSLTLFKNAFEMEQKDPVILDNVVSAYVATGRQRDGWDYLSLHAPKFPGDTRIKDRQKHLKEIGADTGA